MSESKESKRIEIRLSGSGGQGLIFAGILLAEAIGIYGDKNVAQTQSYGPEARGGASRSDVVISEDIIFYPKTTELDILLALTQEACDSYYPALRGNGTLIVDSTYVSQVPTDKVYSIPFTRIAREKIGTPVVANVMSLGALAAITNVVKLDELEQVVLSRAPRGTEDKNRAALNEGFELGEKALKDYRAKFIDTPRR